MSLSGPTKLVITQKKIRRPQGSRAFQKRDFFLELLVLFGQTRPVEELDTTYLHVEQHHDQRACAAENAHENDGLRNEMAEHERKATHAQTSDQRRQPTLLEQLGTTCHEEHGEADARRDDRQVIGEVLPRRLATSEPYRLSS